MSRSRPLLNAAHALNDGPFTPVDWALFIGVSVIWGSSFLLIAEALETMSPGVVTLGRVGLGALTLSLLRLRQPTSQRIASEDRSMVLLLAVLWVGVPFTLFPLAQQHINSAVAGLLNGATPIFVGVVSILFVRTTPTGRQFAGLVVGFLGVVLVSLGSASGGATEVRGVVLVVLATVCYGFAINIAAPLQAKYGAITLMSTILTLATIWVAPFGLWSLGESDWSLRSVAALGLLGAVGTGSAYWIMASLVGRVGAVRASFITYLIPVVSLVLGVSVRGDDVRAVAVAGALLTIGGAFLASRRATPR